MSNSSSTPMSGDERDVEFFELMDRHLPRAFVWVMRRLPRDPRCRLCSAPFAGFGGRVMRRFGFGPSRKNPTLCNTCFEKAPMGGVEMEIGVLFADVRGFTALAEQATPDQVASLLNRFYGVATDVLSKHAVIDKLVGDEVMALYIPQLFRGSWQHHMVEDASELLAATGYAPSAEPWLQLGVGLDLGPAYVGNVGSGEVKDFTALGDVVNSAARLQSCARAGQIVVSERLFEQLGDDAPEAAGAEFEVKGKSAPQRARVIDVGALTPPVP